MNKADFQKFNTLTTGIIAGMVVPIIVFFILYYSKLQDVSITLFSNSLVIGNIIPLILSHCVLPNLIVFFIFNGLDWMQASKGILGTTVVLTVLTFLVKLIFSVL
jgi:hypothetical protein